MVEPRSDTDSTPDVAIDPIPPTARHLPARLLRGPTLRAQSDRRLVGLVREGHESAFEEIVRRYRRPLDRFAASIVGSHAADVTQDSFGKALVALRHAEADVELRPWLFRIVRNTALNDLRDRPPAAAELAEDLVAGGRSAAAEAEQRAEIEALVTNLRALPENQRAALVMRELEGMSHEEIAAALQISDGAARQAIARARSAIRSGLGVLVPIPLLRALTGEGDRVAAGLGGGAAAAAGAGGVGAGALKIGLATVVVAGTLGAGVAIEHHGGDNGQQQPTGVASAPSPARAAAPRAPAPLPPSPGEFEGSEKASSPTRSAGAAGDSSRHHRGQGGADLGGSRTVPVAQPTTTVAAPETAGDVETSGGGPGPSRDAGGHGGTGGRGEDVHQSSGSGQGGSRDSGDGGHEGSRGDGGSSSGEGTGHESLSGGDPASGGQGGGSDGPGDGSRSGTLQTAAVEDGGSGSGDSSGSDDSGGDSSGSESAQPTEAIPPAAGETVPPGDSEPSP
jgi:RNA polymerase sigma factor (sigma-70 family)